MKDYYLAINLNDYLKNTWKPFEPHLKTISIYLKHSQDPFEAYNNI